MNVNEVTAKLAKEHASFERLGVTSLRLFGSMARGEAAAESDADFLVKFRTPPDFDRYMAVKELLESTLGVSIDLVTEDALRAELRADMERDSIRVT